MLSYCVLPVSGGQRGLDYRLISFVWEVNERWAAAVSK
jgi:hypothetical protein